MTVQAVEHSLLLLVTSASDLIVPIIDDKNID